MGERIRRVKIRKLVGWDKDSLVGKAKAARTSKAKQGIHSPLPIGRQVFSHLQEGWAPLHVTVTWEDKRHLSEHPPFLLLPQLCMLSMTSYGMGYPFGQLRSALPASYAPPAYSLVGGCEMQKRPWRCVSTAQQYLQRRCVTNTVFITNPKHSPILATVKKINPTPAKTSTEVKRSISWWRHLEDQGAKIQAS